MQPVFIGDVQGCADELDEAIGRAQAAFGAGGFELWLVGDLVNRGPDNLRVLRNVRERVEGGRARVVLGNHDLALIAVGLGLRRVGLLDTFTDVLDAPDAADWLEWLSRLPLVETGQLGETPFAMVHAAAAPAWDLQALRQAAAAPEARLRKGGKARRSLLQSTRKNEPDREVRERLTRGRAAAADGSWSDHEP